MATPNWRVFPDANDRKVEFTSFHDATKFFAVDASGSTGGSPIRSEEAFVTGLYKGGAQTGDDWFTLWGSSCNDPTNAWKEMQFNSRLGGTSPSEILRNERALGCIHSSDIWILLTDGEVWDREVKSLATIGQELGVFSAPTIFVITSHLSGSPNDANVSVGITSYANAEHALCLFKDHRSGRIYVIAAKGCFEPLDQAKHRDFWESLSQFEKEADLIAKIDELDIQVPTAATRPTALAAIVNLRAGLAAAHQDPIYVDVSELLKAGVIGDEDLELLMRDEALDILALAYKTRGRLPEYRSFLLSQKVEQETVKLEDIAGASEIIAKLGEAQLSEVAKANFQAQLRAAHKKNQEAYNANLNTEAGERIRKRNRLIDHSLSQLADVEKAGYTAEILSRRSNRARRAEITSANDSSVVLTRLDLNAPAFKSECLVCCGEDEIMSIVLKRLDQEESAANTADFALDFPLAAGRFPANLNIISSQSICFQCALFGLPGRSIYKEDIAAILPTLEYKDSNKMYINQQLYLALNGGLKTGVPQVAQLFATVLDRTLQTKAWAGATSYLVPQEQTEDVETKRRRESLQWFLDTVIANIRCRETFNELGIWTTYPKALAWAAKDFETEGLSSWAVNYPIAGFNQLLRFGKMNGVFTDEMIQHMKSTKLIHSLVSLYLAKLLKNGAHITKDSIWAQQVLELVYSKFNADLVPRDLGGRSTVLNSTEKFWVDLTKFLASDPELLSGYSEIEKQNLMPRLQILIFWLVYYQRNHTSAKTYFNTLRTSEPLANTVLDLKSKLPTSLITERLLLLFRNTNKFINEQLARTHVTGTVRFATPFGASVLRCGMPGCDCSFVPEDHAMGEKWTLKDLDQLRQARAAHLIQAFGTSFTFAENQTGLPEATDLPKPPSSTHTTLHISIARAWGRQTISDRRAIVNTFVPEMSEASGGIPYSLPASEQRFAGQLVVDFVEAVRKEICVGSHRGDIFASGLDKQILEVLPSFFQILSTAVKLAGSGSVATYEIDFKLNKLAWKVEFEETVVRMGMMNQDLGA